MHHSLIRTSKIFLSILLISIISGCFGKGAGVDLIEKKYETDAATVEIQIPEFKNLADDDFQEAVNAEYAQMVELWLKDFAEKCEKNTNTSEKFLFRLTQKVTLSDRSFLSVVGEAYVFTEGVHGTSSRIVRNIDTASNQIIKLPDLFQDPAFEMAINREITQIVEKNPEEYHDLWEKPVLSANHENFYLSTEGLVIFYPPYELSYYARGFVEFCIPYEALSGYLKPEYYMLLQS